MKKLLMLLAIIFAVSTTANAQKLFSKEWKQQQLGKDSASVAKKQAEEAQKATKKINPYGFRNPIEGVKISGRLLKKSANYQYGAYLCMIAGSGAAIGAAYMDKKSERNTMLIAGGGVAFIGLMLQLKSIDYKFKSGQVLELSAGRVGLKF